MKRVLEFEDGMKVITSGVRFRVGGKSPVSYIPVSDHDFNKLVKNHHLTKNYTKGRIDLSERTHR